MLSSRGPAQYHSTVMQQDATTTRKTRRTDVWVCLLLALATIATYWQVTGHDFISYDDLEYVTGNPHVQDGFTPGSFVWAFGTTHTANWHPLTWLSHLLDIQLYGMNPRGHHVSGLLLHVTNAILLFAVFRRMTGAVWPSAFVAAFFALHPLHVESVAWVAERKDVLSALFWMLSLWSYVRYVERPGPKRYLAVVAFFFLGLLSKPMVVSLPFVLLLLDYWPLGRLRAGLAGGRQLVLEKVPLFALAAVVGVVTFLAQQGGGTVRSLAAHPIPARIANALLSYVFYLGQMIWPIDLAVFYPYPRGFPWWQVLVAGLLLALLSLFSVRLSGRAPYVIVGWLWYLGTLVPVIGLVQVGAQARADRYTYLPLIGISLALAWGVPALVARWRYRNISLAVVASAVLAALAVTSAMQVRHWADSEKLFEHALRATRDNDIAHYNLGLGLASQGRTFEAIDHFLAAVRIDPRFADAHNNLGNALEHQGRTAEAIRHYEEALRIDPAMASAHYNLGLALARRGDTIRAIVHFNEALRIRPAYAQAHNNLGIVLIDLGRTTAAIDHFTEALRIDPDSATAHYNLGVVLASQGKHEQAIAHFAEALRIDPAHADARRKLDSYPDPH